MAGSQFSSRARRRIIGYIGWNLAAHGPDGEAQPAGTSGRLEMVAVHPEAQRHGVAFALARHVLASLKERGVAVVHIGTGGDTFHRPARKLYESLGFTAYPVVDYTKAL